MNHKAKSELIMKVQNLIQINSLSEAKKLISSFGDSIYKDVDMLSTISVIYILEGDLAEAQRHIDIGLSIEQNNFDLTFNLAYIYEMKKDYIEAIKQYKKAKTFSKNESTSSSIDQILQQLSMEIKSLHKCNICNSEFEKFVPWPYTIPEVIRKFNMIGSDVMNYACPFCGNNDRTRHLFAYFSKLNLWNLFDKQSKVLHIAPERFFMRLFKEALGVEYVGGDLYPDASDKDIEKVDITDIQYPDNHFDFIMCNHVLEHVQDDKKAIGELYRVLKEGGFAILQTPYSPIREKSYENPLIVTEKERNEHFGQEDHVRIYGLDLFQRLFSVGFKPHIIKNTQLFIEEESHYFGFNHKEDLILLSK